MAPPRKANKLTVEQIEALGSVSSSTNVEDMTVNDYIKFAFIALFVQIIPFCLSLTFLYHHPVIIFVCKLIILTHIAVF